MSGVLEAITRAMGGVLNELGGQRFTRAVSLSPAGSSSVFVETTHEWPAAGVAYINGQSYLWSGKTPTALTGLSYFEGTTEIFGLRNDVNPTDEVLDFSRVFNDLEKLRSGFFVNTAAGSDLSTLGRGLGVDRPPTLTDDAIFREIIKATAYVPKGTIWALELALTAFFGAGNFVIYENLVNNPNTVFIRLTGAGLSLSTSSIGKTYVGLDRPEPLDDAASEVTLQEAALYGIIAGATLEDEVHEGALSAVFPTALTEIRYAGDAGIPVWEFDPDGSGTSEGVEVTAGEALDGGTLRINTAGADVALYRHYARVQPQSEAYIDSTMHIVDLGGSVAPTNLALQINDGSRVINMGFNHLGSGVFRVGASNGNSYIAPLEVNFFPYVEQATYAIRKRLDGVVELSRNGLVFQTVLDASLFAATAETSFVFGVRLGGVDVHLRDVNFNAQTATDYWNERGTVADVNTVSPTTLDTNSASLLVADVGKPLRVFNSQVLNAEGGSNNGDWIIDTFIDADNVTLVGLDRQLAFVETVHPGRVSAAATTNAFRYPDDQGKTLEILGASANAGDVLVTHIVDRVTGFPIAGDVEDESDQVLVVGPATGSSGANGAVNTAASDRFVDATYNSFAIGDVGRLILIRAAGNPGNVGVFQITAFVSPSEVVTNSVSIGQTFTTEGSLVWELRETTGYVTETGLDYRLKPNFVTEVGTLSWELSDAGSVVGVVGTLRNNPPFDYANIELILRVRYTQVLSAQLVPNETIATAAIPATMPVEYTNYPFFMPASLLGAFESFLDELTVAGVIPELLS